MILVNYIETNLRHIKLSWSGANIIQLPSYLMYKRKGHTFNDLFYNNYYYHYTTKGMKKFES